MWWSLAERKTAVLLGLTGLAALAILVGQPRLQPEPALEAAVSSGWVDALEASRRIDINEATTSELERLPGIGPSLAARLVADRLAHGRFNHVQELERVPGIGPKTRQALAPYVTMGD